MELRRRQRRRCAGRRRGGAGKATVQSLHLAKPLDKPSIALFVACCTGQHLKSATLVCRHVGQVPFEFLTLALSDVVKGPNGQPLPQVTGGWDLLANRKL